MNEVVNYKKNHRQSILYKHAKTLLLQLNGDGIYGVIRDKQGIWYKQGIRYSEKSQTFAVKVKWWKRGKAGIEGGDQL